MSTFNAGAIEATLTLDRSPWNRELKAAQGQATRFSNRKISPKLTIDGLEKLAQLAAMIETVDDKDIDITLDIVGKDDLLTTALLVNNLDGKDIDLNIDVNGYGELVAAAAIVKTLDGSDIDIDIDPKNGIGHAIGGFSRMQALVLAILVILPLVAPMVAVLTAAVVGLAAGLVAASGALGAVALGVAPTVKNMMELNEEIQKQEVRLAGLTPGTKAYTDQQKKISNLQHEMATRFGAASEGLDRLRESWEKWTKATEGPSQQIIGAALTVAGQAIEAFIPVFEAAAPVIKGMFTSIGSFLSSGEGQEMIDFFATFGVEALQSFISIGGNLLRFLGNLFDAFAPFGGSLLEDIDAVTASWAEWARGLKDSEGFQDFMEYVAVEGPKVWEFIKSFIGALINLGVALAPLGSVALDAFTAIFSWIQNTDPTILGAIVIGLGTAVTAILAVAAAMAILNFVLAMNPFILLAIAIIALIAAIVYLWNTNEGFKNAIIAVWDAIVGAVETAINWLRDNVLPILTTIWEGIKTGFQAVADVVNPIILLIVQIVQQGFSNLMAVVGPVMAFISGAVRLGFAIISAIVSTVMPIVMSIVTGAFGVIRAVVTTVMNVVRAIWTTAWNVIKAVFTAVINTIKAVLTTVLAAMRGDVSGVLNGIRSIFSSVWNGIRAVVTAVVSGIRSAVSAGMNGIRSVISAIMSAVAGVFRSTWATIRGVVSGGISAIRGMFSGAGSWLIGAGRSIIQGLINGIRAMAGNVGSAVRGVLSAARDLLPFSPAKKGPFSGKGWTLYSGRSIVAALAQGMKDEVPGLRSSAYMVAGAAKDALAMDPTYGMRNRTPVLAGVGGGERQINVNLNNYYPLPERSSAAAIREVTRLGQLGVFDG